MGEDAVDVIVRAAGLGRRYPLGPAGDKNGRVALVDVDLVVPQGEFLCVLGPSGSGKSTLLGVVGALDRRYEGKVELFGKDLARLSDRAVAELRGQRLGFVFQSFHLLSHLTVLQNVTAPALFGGDASGADARGMALLERLGLADRASDRPAQLSGGQRQRVAIARALLNEPSLLLCDEPTGNLDEEIGAQAIELLAELHREKDITIVAVTHEERLARVATRTLMLRDGRLTEQEPA